MNKLKTYSMTGFGSASGSYKNVKIHVEVKSLNNRYLDINLKLPKEYASNETEIRRLVSEDFKRGRFDISVTRKAIATRGSVSSFDKRAFQALLDLYKQIGKQEKIFSNDFHIQAVLQILNRREIYESDELETILNDKESVALMNTVIKALLQLKGHRKREGLRLGEDLRLHLSNLEKIRSEINKCAGEAKNLHYTRLKARLSELNNDIQVDEQRLISEIAIMLDRSDISEELVRLTSHIIEANQALAETGSGKRLEFLLQELAREFNTISSKSSDIRITRSVVNAKTIVEKVREQVQNLE